MSFSSVDRVRHHSRPQAEGTLHQHDIDPAAEFEADGRQYAHPSKAQCSVQADRRPGLAAADDRDHLSIAEYRAAVEEAAQPDTADAASDFRRIDIDRVFEREPIGRAQTVRA